MHGASSQCRQNRKTKALTKKEIKSYLKDSGRCPKCKSNDIEGSHMEADGDMAWQSVRCATCDFEWDDIYKLVNIEEKSVPKKTHVRVISIPQREVTRLNRILRRKTAHPDWQSDGVIETFTAAFDLDEGKWEVDIKVCNGDSPYVDPVLFKIANGTAEQVCTGEATDTLLGEYYFATKEAIFQVNVIGKKGDV